MGKNKKKGAKDNVFKVAGAKSLKKAKAKAVNLGLKNGNLRQRTRQPIKKYTRKPNSRRYIEYTKKQLEDCLEAVRSKRLTQREAAEFYDIPRSTVKIKLTKTHCQKPGRQMTFSDEEEELFVSHIKLLTRFGFPVSNFDIKMLVKDYLRSQNRIVRIFKNNLPGRDWLNYFFERHEPLPVNQSSIDKALDVEAALTEFFGNINNEFDDVPPENIFAYEEICFRDDIRRHVNKRGTRYPGNMTQATKPNYSVLFCGSAAGEIVPPYITYKSEHVCSSWTENGPEGAGYNSTYDGWVDIESFEDWFQNYLFPILKKRPGRKVLLGDYVSTHIGLEVMAECIKNGISFICLPIQSGHVQSPLEYSFYNALKSVWKKLIIEWKKKQIDNAERSVPKSEFPALLNRALNYTSDTKEKIILGFRLSGIHPINVQEFVSRWVKQDETDASRQKNNTEKYILSPDNEETGEINFEYSFEEIDASEIKQENTNDLLSDNEIEETVPENDMYLIIVKDEGEVVQIPINKDENLENPMNIAVGDYVILLRESSNYPGQVLAISEEGAYVYCMEQEKPFWVWPEATNTQFYSWDDIVCKIEPPKQIADGIFSVSELECSDSESE